MKYSDKNKPLVCMMTQSTCYRGTRKFTPKGVLWHSTGANNPYLKRYVQPDDNAADRGEWLNRLGKNQYGNDWNHIDRQAGLNFWIGKLADGSVAAVQTMPWDFRPWGCGSGSKGSCNNTHIQFEICEDGLNDEAYFRACYKEACEVTAYLCQMYGIDPLGTCVTNGVNCPTIIDHIGSHKLGLGSNHGDIQHWSKRYGITMANVRHDVAVLLKGAGQVTPSDPVTPDVPASDMLRKGDKGDAVRAMQEMLIACGYDLGSWGADGSFGKQTEVALIQFQQDNKLAVDGVYGSESKTALEQAYKAATAQPDPEPTPAVYYRVRKSWEDKDSQLGAYTSLAYAKRCADANPGYSVYDEKGVKVYPNEDIISPTPSEAQGITDEEKYIWDELVKACGNEYGAAGMMGNLYDESALHSNNLQNNGNSKLGLTDAEFTAKVDEGGYPHDTFIHDGYGYGIAQWTYYSRKDALWKAWQKKGGSIGSLIFQMEFLIAEAKSNKTVWNAMCNGKSVRAVSDVILTKYERPADQSEKVQERRAGFGQTFYDKYAGTKPTDQTLPVTPEEEIPVGVPVSEKQKKYLYATGTHYISNSGSDENKQYSGGRAGDQTGNEWCLRSWYNRPWNVVLRHPDQNIALKIALLGIDAALNDHIGYDQSQRETYWKQLQAAGYEPSRIGVDCEEDCSAGVLANVRAVGYLMNNSKLKNCSGSYTGNMRSGLVAAGFKALTEDKYLTSGNYLLPGDILLNESHHTATNVTLGKNATGWNPGGEAPAPIPIPTPTGDVPYRVKVSITDLLIRTAPGTDSKSTGQCTGKGVFTIMEEATGTGATMWGRLKSGAGWISLDYCTRLD